MIEIPISPEDFQTKVVERAAKQGIAITGHQGTIEKMGVKASYLYQNGVLKIEILEKPFFVSEEMCEKQLRAWM